MGLMPEIALVAALIGDLMMLPSVMR